VEEGVRDVHRWVTPGSSGMEAGRMSARIAGLDAVLLRVPLPPTWAAHGVTHLEVVHVTVADDQGARLCPHFLPELHVHLVAAARAGGYVEHFPLLDPLLEETLPVAGGVVRALRTARDTACCGRRQRWSGTGCAEQSGLADLTAEEAPAGEVRRCRAGRLADRPHRRRYRDHGVGAAALVIG
jgi:hypothetical protein